jgi:hypothetical protein
MPGANLVAILRALSEQAVDYIVVGGVAAVLQGAPTMTFDIDVVHSTAPENVTRLLGALEKLSAYYRVQPDRRLRPDASHLISRDHQLLMTDFGPLDVLGQIGNGRTYADLLPHCERVAIAADLTVPVLDLETLITVKEEVGAEKDRAVLPLLRRTLVEKRRK